MNLVAGCLHSHSNSSTTQLSSMFEFWYGNMSLWTKENFALAKRCNWSGRKKNVSTGFEVEEKSTGFEVEKEH